MNYLHSRPHPIPSRPIVIVKSDDGEAVCSFARDLLRGQSSHSDSDTSLVLIIADFAARRRSDRSTGPGDVRIALVEETRGLDSPAHISATGLRAIGGAGHIH